MVFNHSIHPLINIDDFDVIEKKPRIRDEEGKWRSGKCNRFKSDELLGLAWHYSPNKIIDYDLQDEIE